MNVFGINVQSRKTLDATMAALTAPATPVDETVPQSIRFGREYNKDASDEMLAGMAANRVLAKRFTKVALFLSIPHQALYVLSKVEIKHATVFEWGETIFALAVCMAVPLLLDVSILMNIRTLTAKVASTASIVRAIVCLLPALAGSMYLNFAAPGVLVLRVLAGSLSLIAAMYQVSLLARPDFRKVGEDEARLARQLADAQAVIAPPAPAVMAASSPSRKPDAAELAARKKAKYDEMDPAQRAAFTKTYRQGVDAKAARDAAKAQAAAANPVTAGDVLNAAGPLDDAPVSGVPATASA